MLHTWPARRAGRSAARFLGGIGLVGGLMVTVGSGLFHVGQALAGSEARRAGVTVSGVDPIPVGTVSRSDSLGRTRSGAF